MTDAATPGAASALIPPEVRARLKTLTIGTRRDAGAQGFGLHRSLSRGAGLEFAQYRAYEQGDALRMIDWKLYARSDRYFVREAERDSPLTLWLLIDTSASMAQTDAATPGWSRLQAAASLAACAIEIALRQGDAFGLACVGGDGVHVVPASRGARHRDRCLLQLTALRARGSWPSASALRPLWERIAARTLVLGISDCFDDALASLLERFAAARREVASVQLVTVEERDFPFHGGHRFRDPETGAEQLGDAAEVREDFLARFAAAQAALAARLTAAGVRHVAHVIDAPVDAPLRQLFGSTAGDHSAGGVRR